MYIHTYIYIYIYMNIYFVGRKMETAGRRHADLFSSESEDDEQVFFLACIQTYIHTYIYTYIHTYMIDIRTNKYTTCIYYAHAHLNTHTLALSLTRTYTSLDAHPYLLMHLSSVC